MAKLIALALAFTALVAFATAHTTIVTTTIEDENPVSRQRQCSQRLQGQRFNQCRMYLHQGQGQGPYDENRQIRGQEIEQCCEELQNVDEQCQCEAVKQVFREAQQQQQGRQQQTGPYGSQQTQRLRQRAEMLPNQCNLQSRQCRIGTVMTTTTTISDESNIDIPFWPFGSDSDQCRQSEIQRPVSQCQGYIQQQIRSQRSTLLMSVVERRQGQQSQGLQQCCNQLQNLNRECQCKAIEEVARQVMRQQQQQGGRSQYEGGRRYGGQQQDQTQIVRRVVQSLPNQCDLEVRQCNIPY
ncbi:hypothetical protein SSX86_024338 [Deinandra increscens subsp. villosa]|uniref:Bifunctional inhibitor/plant lipid transfer protein/seed storage helical domain-containing protein n=1 Tax=Deinandra increscens subsp. villosa TaxID=3103831 RepID=A0AAP0CL51_9ASTR